MSGRCDRLVVVGASLAGLRAAQALRRHGHDGDLVVVGDEPHLPYDRPPLSKQLLDGSWTRAQLDLPVPAELDVQWRLGQAARALDLQARRVHLPAGQHLDYDGLVIATGARARPWPDHPPQGVHTLRTADDATALSSALQAVDRLLVIGAGFLGGEVAAAARRRGLAVTLVEPQPQPLLNLGGPALGSFVAELHRRAGIDLRLSTRVTTLTADDDGQFTGAHLDDGSQVTAPLALVALGAVPNTDWLTGSGLQINRGVICDNLCRPLLADGTAAPDIVAAGDVTRWPHPLSDGLLSLGHWSNATDQAHATAHTLLQPQTAVPFAPVPSFWSDLHGVQIRAVGLPQQADRHHVIEHDTQRQRLVLTYDRREKLIGAITVNRTSRLAHYRNALHQQLQHAEEHHHQEEAGRARRRVPTAAVRATRGDPTTPR